MDINTYQTENTPLNVPISIEQEQDERSNKKWKGIYAASLGAMVLVSYRAYAGYSSNANALRASLVSTNQNDPVMEGLTTAIGAVYPPILEGALKPFDPIDLGGDWSQTISVDIPGCPSSIDVKFDLGSITGLSSFDVKGLTLEMGKYECTKWGGWRSCDEGAFEGTWSEEVSFQALKAEASATLVGDAACLGEIADTKVTGTASLNDPSLEMFFSAEGTLHDYFGFSLVRAPTSAKITSSTVESLDADSGTLKAGISFAAWGNEVAGFEETFEDWIHEEVEAYIEDVIKEAINDSIEGQLPLEFSLLG